MEIKNTFADIADAIRFLGGGVDVLTPAQMASELGDLIDSPVETSVVVTRAAENGRVYYFNNGQTYDLIHDTYDVQHFFCAIITISYGQHENNNPTWYKTEILFNGRLIKTVYPQTDDYIAIIHLPEIDVAEIRVRMSSNSVILNNTYLSQSATLQFIYNIESIFNIIGSCIRKGEGSSQGITPTNMPSRIEALKNIRVKFMDYFGDTTLQQVIVEHGGNAVFSGDVIVPAATDDYYFTHDGWSDEQYADVAKSGVLDAIKRYTVLYQVLSAHFVDSTIQTKVTGALDKEPRIYYYNGGQTYSIINGTYDTSLFSKANITVNFGSRENGNPQYYQTHIYVDGVKVKTVYPNTGDYTATIDLDGINQTSIEVRAAGRGGLNNTYHTESATIDFFPPKVYEILAS